MTITIVGLGPGDPAQLTREAWDVLSSAGEVYARTARHPTLAGLPAGLAVHSFDDIYDSVPEFDRVLAPLEAAGLGGKYNVSIVVKGGGITGQVDAAKLGVARALLKLDPALRPPMRKGNFLTRDPREKERKKPGLKRARKAPTYTKR